MNANLKLDLSGAPEEVIRSNLPEPGDVYAKAGGAAGFWVVVAVTPNGGQCVVMSFDTDGQVTGAQRYGLHYFRDNSHRRRVGTVEIPQFNVTWEPIR